MSDGHEVTALKSTIQQMEAELARQRSWEKHVMGGGSGAEVQGLRLDINQKSEEIVSLRSQLSHSQVQLSSRSTDDHGLRVKLDHNEREVTELRTALAECLESLRLKESIAPAALENRVVSLESQIMEAKTLDDGERLPSPAAV